MSNSSQTSSLAASQAIAEGAQRARRTHPAAWVPTLYFAEGVPYLTVSALAVVLYQRLSLWHQHAGQPGLSNEIIAFYTSLLLLPWSLKPLWSPLLEMYKTKKFFVVLFEFLGGLTMAAVGLCLPLPGYFGFTVALFGVMAFCSSTHDIAADGLYIASLSAKQQAAYAGWQGAFYNIARLFAQGGLVILAGVLEKRMAAPHAWLIVFVMTGGILLLLSLYHSRMLPTGGEERKSESLRQVAETFGDVVVTFFRKPGIYIILAFIFLYRAAEGQVERIRPLFLLDPRQQVLHGHSVWVGGLGLTPEVYGTISIFATGTFVLGSILGGYFASWLGLKRALLWLLLALNARNVAYVYLSTVLPSNMPIIWAAILTEMFIYGFGFVGVIVLMFQEVAPGRYQTAHYAFANSLMNLGLMVPGMVSGKIQTALGYHHFFLWVLIWVLPPLALLKFIPFRHQGASPAAQPAET